MASLLGSLVRGRVSPHHSKVVQLIAPSFRGSVISVRAASDQSKQQKKTVAKYAARQANKTKKTNDFLTQVKQQAKGKKGVTTKKVAKADDIYEDTAKDVDEDEEGEEEEEPQPEISSESAAYGVPDFRYTLPRYEEYEEYIPPKEHEEVTGTILNLERKSMVKRLWEPYETEDFNLKKLLGDAVDPENVEGPDVVIETKPSKMLYYSEEELSKFLPEGIAGRISRQYEEFRTPEHEPIKGVMVRPVVEDVIGWMAEWRERQFIGRDKEKDYYTLLGGPIGCGKSCCLNPIVHWARMTGWLVVYIPDGRDWASHGRLSYSKINETWFGQPELATKWIKALLSAHADKLSSIYLRTDFVVSDVDPDKPTFTSTPTETLKSLLDYGLKHPDQASDCVYYLRQELGTVTEYPVLIAVDGVNIVRDHSIYGDPIDPYVFAPNLHTSRLVLSRAFQDFRDHGLVNGLYVGALSTSASLKPLKVKKSNPDLKKQEWVLDPKLSVIEVPKITRGEARVLADYYAENKLFTEDKPPPTQTVDYMWAMSQGNGDIFWRQAKME